VAVTRTEVEICTALFTALAFTLLLFGPRRQ
jgi:hypothetical protein